MLGTAVLAGKDVQNFNDTYKMLIERGAARLVTDKDMLAGAVNFLLKNDSARKAMSEAGLKTVEEMRGSLSATLQALGPFIQPLILKSRLESGEPRRR